MAKNKGGIVGVLLAATAGVVAALFLSKKQNRTKTVAVAKKIQKKVVATEKKLVRKAKKARKSTAKSRKK